LKSREADIQVSGMRPKHFLVRDPGAASLSQCLNHGAGISGVGDRGHPRCPTGGKAGVRGGEKLLPSASCFALANAHYPLRKVRLGRTPLESSELQMGMGVDQSWDQDGIAVFLSRHGGRARNAIIPSHRDDPAVVSDQHRTPLDRMILDRGHPPGRQAAGWHASAENSVEGPRPPLHPSGFP
jgi:hypothetical protein